eukprot:jgi/Mesvir1/1605/Mv14568-RA.2
MAKTIGPELRLSDADVWCGSALFTTALATVVHRGVDSDSAAAAVSSKETAAFESFKESIRSLWGTRDAAIKSPGNNDDESTDGRRPISLPGGELLWGRGGLCEQVYAHLRLPRRKWAAVLMLPSLHVRTGADEVADLASRPDVQGMVAQLRRAHEAGTPGSNRGGSAATAGAGGGATGSMAGSGHGGGDAGGDSSAGSGSSAGGSSIDRGQHGGRGGGSAWGGHLSDPYGTHVGHREPPDVEASPQAKGHPGQGVGSGTTRDAEGGRQPASSGSTAIAGGDASNRDASASTGEESSSKQGRTDDKEDKDAVARKEAADSLARSEAANEDEARWVAQGVTLPFLWETIEGCIGGIAGNPSSRWYDARAREAVKLMARLLDVPWSQVSSLEGLLASTTVCPEPYVDESNPGSKTAAAVKRGMLIGAAAGTAGALLAITGGAIAPALAAGMATTFEVLGMTGAMAGTVTALTTTTTVAAGFGTWGAHTAATHMANRVGVVEEFMIVELPDERQQARERVWYEWAVFNLRNFDIRDSKYVRGLDKAIRLNNWTSWGVREGEAPPEDVPKEAVQLAVEGSLGSDQAPPPGGRPPAGHGTGATGDGRPDASDQSSSIGASEGQGIGGVISKGERSGNASSKAAEGVPSGSSQEEEKPSSGPKREEEGFWSSKSWGASLDALSSAARSVKDSFVDAVTPAYFQTKEVAMGAGVTLPWNGDKHKKLSVTIAISGWATEREDFEDVWVSLASEDSERHVLVWESEKVLALGNALVGFVAQQIKRTAITALKMQLAAALVSAMALPMWLMSFTQYIDMPWQVVSDRAPKAGRLLAEVLLSRSHGDRPVNLIGFSFGASVVYHCLLALAESGAEGVVGDVVLLGACVGLDQVHLTFSYSDRFQYDRM